MKLAIIGGREFNEYETLKSVMLTYFQPIHVDDVVTEIISGGARGADSLGARWAKERGIKLTEFIPDWDRYGKRAGFMRNEDIIKAADVVLAFWDSESRGTQNSLSIAKRLKKPTVIIYF